MNCELGASCEVQAFWSATADLDVSINTAFKVKAGAPRKELPSSHSRPAHCAGKQKVEVDGGLAGSVDQAVLSLRLGQ